MVSPAVWPRPIWTISTRRLPERERSGECQRRPGEAGRDRVLATEQARKAADLGRLVLLAALHDQLARGVGRDDFRRLVGGGAEHAHGVIVRQQHILDRLRRHRFDPRDDVLSHGRCRLRVDHHAAVAALDDAGVGVALGGICVEPAAEPGERHFLLSHVRGRGEARHGHEEPPSSVIGMDRKPRKRARPPGTGRADSA